MVRSDWSALLMVYYVFIKKSSEIKAVLWYLRVKGYVFGFSLTAAITAPYTTMQHCDLVKKHLSHG